jgi:hypothetical protein
MKTIEVRPETGGGTKAVGKYRLNSRAGVFPHSLLPLPFNQERRGRSELGQMKHAGTEVEPLVRFDDG